MFLRKLIDGINELIDRVLWRQVGNTAMSEIQMISSYKHKKFSKSVVNGNYFRKLEEV